MKVLGKKATNEILINAFALIVLIGLSIYLFTQERNEDSPTYYYYAIYALLLYLFVSVVIKLINPSEVITTDGTYLYIKSLKKEQSFKLSEITGVSSRRTRHSHYTYKYGNIFIETTSGKYRSPRVAHCEEVEELIFNELKLTKIDIE
jgi:hypothetical protein